MEGETGEKWLTRCLEFRPPHTGLRFCWESGSSTVTVKRDIGTPVGEIEMSSAPENSDMPTLERAAAKWFAEKIMAGKVPEKQDFYGLMTRSPAYYLPLGEAVIFLQQSAHSWVHLKREPRDGFIHVSLHMPWDQKHKGYEGDIFRALCDVADKRQWHLTYNPLSYEFGDLTALSEKEAFYASYGFVRNSKERKIPQRRAWWYRTPKEES